MDITNIRSAIKVEFDVNGMPGKNEIDEAVNECIRDINNRTPAIKALIKITGDEDAEATWGDTTTVWGSATTIWGETGRFINGFSFDSTDYYLTIPDNIISVKQLYINDIAQIPKPYEAMINTESASEDFFYLLYGTRITSERGYFTQYGRKIYFQVDLGAETSVIKLEVEMEFGKVNEDELEVPTFFTQYLISNCVSILGSRSKNLISETAYMRHYKNAERAFRDILNRETIIEESKNMDIW